MKIVCIGDSLTFGYGLKNPKDNWVNLLENSTGHTFINSGINGNTTFQMLSRFSSDALSYRPDYIHIMGGGNDYVYTPYTHKESFKNIQLMVEDAISHGVSPIVGIPICADPVLTKARWSEETEFEYVNEEIKLLRKLLISFCQEKDIAFIDYNKAFEEGIKNKNISKYSIDGLHPTPEGQKLLFLAFEKSFICCNK